MEGKVTLGYWAIRGLAERIRQLLEYLSIPYQEDRYEGAEGRAKWFSEVKPTLTERNPALTLPYLIDGDKVVTESDAILIYLCHKGGRLDLLGRNADEQVLLATAHGVYKDFHPKYIQLVYGTYNENATFEHALTASFNTFEPYLKKLDGILGEKDFIAGGLTWFDFAVADFLQTLQLLNEVYLKAFPKLVAYQKRVWALPELAAYFSSERFRERPCNNYTASWK
jgi:glutathione S-transferase